jgi:hypothetical protein
MKEHVIKFCFLIVKHGRLNLSKSLNMSYKKFMKLEKNPDLLNIGQIKIIDELYNDMINKL